MLNKELERVLMVFVRLAQSRKFWALLFAVLASEFAIDVNADTQALIYMLAASIFAGTTALEDAAEKHATTNVNVTPRVVEQSSQVVDSGVGWKRGG